LGSQVYTGSGTIRWAEVSYYEPTEPPIDELIGIRELWPLDSVRVRHTVTYTWEAEMYCDPATVVHHGGADVTSSNFVGVWDNPTGQLAVGLGVYVHLEYAAQHAVDLQEDGTTTDCPSDQVGQIGIYDLVFTAVVDEEMSISINLGFPLIPGLVNLKLKGIHTWTWDLGRTTFASDTVTIRHPCCCAASD